MADADLSAELAAIRERAEGLTASHADEDCEGAGSCTGHDALRMEEGYRELLAIAAEWIESAEPWRQMSSSASRQIHCADTLRAAITAALTREESTNEA